MRERVFIIIDGSNFYHQLKESGLIGLLNFDYKKLTRFLLGKRMLIANNYYIGAIREEQGNLKSKKLMINQQKLISKLRNCGWQTSFGHMLKTDGYHEKGVDVLMAVVLLVFFGLSQVRATKHSKFRTFGISGSWTQPGSESSAVEKRQKAKLAEDLLPDRTADTTA